MATEQQLRNAGLREVYISGTASDTDKYLRSQIATLNKQLRAGAVSNMTRKQLESTIGKLNKLLSANLSEYQTTAHESAVALAITDAQTEAGLLASMTGAGVTTPTDKRVRASTKNVSIVDYATGKKTTANRLFSVLDKQNQKQIGAIIRAGYANEQSTDEILEQLVGVRVTPANGKPYYSGGYVNSTHKRDANTVVRTVTNAMSQEARKQTWKENGDLVSGIEYVATLDNRTTMLCASLDGTVWAIDDPNAPQPPLHFGCRSTTVPVVAGMPTTREGERVAKTADGDVTKKQLTSEKTWQKKERTTRAEVPAKTNYDQFLRGEYSGGKPQPDWFLKDVLKTDARVEIYKSNPNIKIGDMLKNGQPMTIDELAEKYGNSAK